MPELNELIYKCLQKDKRSEYQLYRTCFSMLMRICIRYTKNEDDAAAQLNAGFYKILTNLSSYDSTRSFDTWAKSIMINTIIDEFKMNKRFNQTMKPVDFIEFDTSMHPKNMNEAEQNLNFNELLKIIQKLPEPEQTIFNLFVFDGFSHKEISKTIGVPESTSRWHLANARKFLQTKINALQPETKSQIV